MVDVILVTLTEGIRFIEKALGIEVGVEVGVTTIHYCKVSQDIFTVPNQWTTMQKRLRNMPNMCRTRTERQISFVS